VTAFALVFIILGAIVLSFDVGQAGLRPVMLALALTVTFILLHDYARRVCFAYFHMFEAFILDLSVAIVQIGGLLLLAHYHLLSAANTYLVLGSACVVVTVVWLIENWENFAPNRKEALSDLRLNWRFGKWVLGGVSLFFDEYPIYPWFLAHTYGAAEAGLYAVCLRGEMCCPCLRP